MKKNVKSNMEKKLQKKKEIEHISNKTLTVFSVALVAEVVLLFIYSALKANSAYLNKSLPWFSLATLLLFVGLLVASCMIKRKTGHETTKSLALKNWGFFTLAVSFSAFYIKANVAVSAILNLFGAADAANYFSAKISRIIGKTGALYLIIAIIVYVIVVFVYYNLKIRKIKKSK